MPRKRSATARPTRPLAPARPPGPDLEPTRASMTAPDSPSGESEACRPGRPRSGECRSAILRATLELVERNGFAGTSIEAIADHAGVGKATIYRWWPDKAHLVMDAFFESTTSIIPFPDTGSVYQDFADQIRLLAGMFRGPRGKLVASLLGGAQHDASLAEAFRERWIKPRRVHGQEVIRRAKERGELPSDLDAHVLMDALYGAVYLRLMVQHQPLTEAFVDQIVTVVMSGAMIRRPKR